MNIERRRKYFEDIFKEHPERLESERIDCEEEEITIEPYEPILKRKCSKKEKEAIKQIKQELGIKRLRKEKI